MAAAGTPRAGRGLSAAAVMKPPILETLDKRVLVCDGAMGTMLYAKGIFLNRSFDELNLTQPDLVAEVHQAYVRAGADVIESNTFGANRVKLAAFGLAERLHAINVQGARIARHAAREEAYVAGAIGPLGIRVEPWGKIGLDEAQNWFREQARALVEGGVDLFVLETFSDINELVAAVRAVRSVADLPVIAQVTTEEDGNSLDGAPPEQFAPALEAAGADVIGLNCSVGPAAMLETVERMAKATSARLSAQPNAGRPRDVEGRNIYLCSPEYMASYARRFVRHGVKLVGGCCGTTPEHVRHIKMALRALAPADDPGAAKGRVVVGAPAPPQVSRVPRERKSRLANLLARGQFARIVSVRPPRGLSADTLVDEARLLRIHGVDALQIADLPKSGARLSPLSVAVLVAGQAGLETLLHYTCRDRTLLGMQSDLLGAHAMGIRNLLITTGEPARVGDYEDASVVRDVDSIGLVNAVTRLNHGLDVGGQPIGPPTAFHIGVAANAGAFNIDEEVRRLHYKLEAGAEFIITHPIFDLLDLKRLLDGVGPVSVPILAGICPIESFRHAEFLANEVPGLRVPARYLQRIEAADAEGRATDEGTAIAIELATALRPMVHGVQVAVSRDRLDAARAVVDAVGG
jgi:homocysteine S-methyltransferase